MKTIVLIGPESTGKSWLTNQLAKAFQAEFTEEYLRYFFDENNGIEKEQMQLVAQRQNQMEDELMNSTAKVVFFDTNILTLKIYYEYYFKTKAKWFQSLYNPSKYDYYLLLDTTVPWVADSQRDSPKVREELYSVFLKELTQLQVPFTVITGNYSDRVAQAKQVVQQLLIPN